MCIFTSSPPCDLYFCQRLAVDESDRCFTLWSDPGKFVSVSDKRTRSFFRRTVSLRACRYAHKAPAELPLVWGYILKGVCYTSDIPDTTLHIYVAGRSNDTGRWGRKAFGYHLSAFPNISDYEIGPTTSPSWVSWIIKRIWIFFIRPTLNKVFRSLMIVPHWFGLWGLRSGVAAMSTASACLEKVFSGICVDFLPSNPCFNLNVWPRLCYRMFGQGLSRARLGEGPVDLVLSSGNASLGQSCGFYRLAFASRCCSPLCTSFTTQISPAVCLCMYRVRSSWFETYRTRISVWPIASTAGGYSFLGRGIKDGPKFLTSFPSMSIVINAVTQRFPFPLACSEVEHRTSFFGFALIIFPHHGPLLETHWD
jgi:hypothetical protein